MRDHANYILYSWTKLYISLNNILTASKFTFNNERQTTKHTRACQWMFQTGAWTLQTWRTMLVTPPGWRMVKSETRRDAEILVRNPSPRLFGEKVSRLKKSKSKPWKNETSRLIKNASEISRSCQNFPRPTFFEVPFATPLNEGRIERRRLFLNYFIKMKDYIVKTTRSLRAEWNGRNIFYSLCNGFQVVYLFDCMKTREPWTTELPRS